MKTGVRATLVCLFLISIGGYSASACVTADTDLSGGGWETSAAADPCGGGHTVLLAFGQVPATDVVPVRENPQPWIWEGYTHHVSWGFIERLILLLPDYQIDITTLDHHPWDPGLNLAASGASL